MRTETYIELEPICECSKCGLRHLHKDRRKSPGTKEDGYLFIYLCPKCSNSTYSVIGDKETKKRRKCKQ